MTWVRIGIVTREWPPDVYGGAGVHVEYLARELARLEEITVHTWGHAVREEKGGPVRQPGIVVLGPG